MKTAQHIAELRTLEAQDLNDRLKEARTELFNLRFQAATGQLENHRQIRAVRRQIAQVLTVIQGRQLGLEERVMQAPDAAVAPKASAGIEHGRDRGGSTTAVAEPEAAAAAATEVEAPPTDEASTAGEAATADEAPAAGEAEAPATEPQAETEEDAK